MRIGMSITSTYRDPTGPHLMIERARAAYAAGVTSLTIGDHHNMSVEYVQNTPMLGRLLADWPDRPAGCLFLVPLWHPVLMAEQIGTLRSLHGDRFIVQTGIGRGDDQFAAFGRTLGTRAGDIEEAIPLVKAMLDGEVVNSERFGIVEGRVGLKGDQPIDWWIGGHVPAALERAARLGDCWYAAPGATVAVSAERLQNYRDAGGERATIRRDALILDDGDEARRIAGELVAKGYRGMSMGQLLVGNADDVGPVIQELHDIGFEEVIVRAMSVPQDLVLETISGLGRLMA